MSVHITAAFPRQQAQQYVKLMDEIGRGHMRGIIFSLNGVAIEAQKRASAGLPKVIDKPAPYTMRSINKRLIPLTATTLENVSSEMFVLPDQSAYLKYQLGEGENVRQPGDIGPADKHIYVPLWRNLRKAGIQPVGGASLPRSTLKRLLKGQKAVKAGGPPAAWARTGTQAGSSSARRASVAYSTASGSGCAPPAHT